VGDGATPVLRRVGTFNSGLDGLRLKPSTDMPAGATDAGGTARARGTAASCTAFVVTGDAVGISCGALWLGVVAPALRVALMDHRPEPSRLAVAGAAVSCCGRDSDPTTTSGESSGALAPAPGRTTGSGPTRSMTVGTRLALVAWWSHHMHKSRPEAVHAQILTEVAVLRAKNDMDSGGHWRCRAEMDIKHENVLGAHFYRPNRRRLTQPVRSSVRSQ
jgi:hypothetical protein